VRIIEVEIPVVVFRTRETAEVPSLNHNIDSIIDRYSKPYSDLYRPAEYAPPCDPPQPSNVIGSIMIDSNHLRGR
jgi:hypothetical protein